MSASSNEFKVVLLNMTSNEVLNFIWVYDQYVQCLSDGESPVNLEDFYHKLYKNYLK